MYNFFDFFLSQDLIAESSYFHVLNVVRDLFLILVFSYQLCLLLNYKSLVAIDLLSIIILPFILRLCGSTLFVFLTSIIYFIRPHVLRKFKVYLFTHCSK